MSNPTYCPQCGLYLKPWIPPMDSPSLRVVRCDNGHRYQTQSWAEPIDDDPQVCQHANEA